MKNKKMSVKGQSKRENKYRTKQANKVPYPRVDHVFVFTILLLFEWMIDFKHWMVVDWTLHDFVRFTHRFHLF